VGDQAGAGAHVQGVLALFWLCDLDKAGSDPAVLALGPAVVTSGDLVEEVDQMVDHLVGGVRVHQGRG